MQRVQIYFPNECPIFTTQINVRVTDINYGNHLANDALVAYLHDARVKFLTTLNYSEFNIEGIALIQADLMVRYKNEAFLNELIQCDLFIGAVSKNSFEMLYRLSTKRGEQSVIIAEAKVGLVCFDYQNKKIKEVPKAFIDKIKC